MATEGLATASAHPATHDRTIDDFFNDMMCSSMVMGDHVGTQRRAPVSSGITVARELI